MTPSTIGALETPCLILDEGRMMRNIQEMHAHLSANGINLRPHLKTAKCAQIAERLVAGQSGAVCVSTLQEADFFARRGYVDQIYTVGISANKLAHVERLLNDGARVCVLIDSLATLAAIEDFAAGRSIRFPVLIEIDCDGRRSGLPADSPLVVPLAVAISRSDNTTLMGVITHAGGSYGCMSTQCIESTAVAERAAAVDAAQAIRAIGIACEVVSVGSTPTARFGKDFSGLTEVRAGVFVFYDLVMANLGVCNLTDIALSVLTTVIGHRRDRNCLITDSGWTALSSDHGTDSQAIDYRSGLVCDEEGKVLSPELLVTSSSQEHGMIEPRSGVLDFERYAIGTRLRILPVHACATAAGHSRYHVTRDNRHIVDVWERIK